MINKEIKIEAHTILKGHWMGMLGITFLYILMSYVVSLLLGSFINVPYENQWIYIVMNTLYRLPFQIFLVSPLFFGYSWIYLELSREHQVNYGLLFTGYKRIFKIFVIDFFRSMLTFLFGLLLIIPAIVPIANYLISPWLLKDHPDLSAKEILSMSKRMMYGHRNQFIKLFLSFIGIIALYVFIVMVGIGIIMYKNPQASSTSPMGAIAVILMILTILPVIIYYTIYSWAAMTVFYRQLTESKDENIQRDYEDEPENTVPEENDIRETE